MVEAAKAAARRPDDAAAQAALKAVVGELRTAVDASVGNALRKQVLAGLDVAARSAASSAIQLMSAANVRLPLQC
jgi:hypothetical protein